MQPCPRQNKESRHRHMIGQELEHPIDKHSRELIVSNIELLLNYCLLLPAAKMIVDEIVNQIPPGKAAPAALS